MFSASSTSSSISPRVLLNSNMANYIVVKNGHHQQGSHASADQCLISSKREKRHPKLDCAEWHKLVLVYVGPETVSREAFIINEAFMNSFSIHSMRVTTAAVITRQLHELL